MQLLGPSPNRGALELLSAIHHAATVAALAEELHVAGRDELSKYSRTAAIVRIGERCIE